MIEFLIVVAIAALAVFLYIKRSNKTDLIDQISEQPLAVVSEKKPEASQPAEEKTAKKRSYKQKAKKA